MTSLDLDQTPLGSAAPARLELRNASCTYEGASGNVEACADLFLKVAPGESVALIGPSGCGKSTTLLMAAGLQRPTSGDVLVDGDPLEGPRAATAFIPQDLGLFPWKTVLQNAELGLRLHGEPPAKARERAQAALGSVGLSGFESAFPKELSGGMRQRLALARALASDADLLLMDEPLSAIDALKRESLQDLLLQLWLERHHCQVLVTHSIEEAVFLGQRIIVFSQRPGRIMVEMDNPDVGTTTWRDSDAFASRCREVRSILEQATSATNDSEGAEEPPFHTQAKDGEGR